MAIHDFKTRFYVANKAINTTGVSDILDTDQVTNPGDGSPMYVNVLLLTCFTGTTTDRTLTLTMESTSTGTPAAGNTVMQLLKATKNQDLDAVTDEGVLYSGPIPANLIKKYTHLRHTASGALTGGYIQVYLDIHPMVTTKQGS